MLCWISSNMYVLKINVALFTACCFLVNQVQSLDRSRVYMESNCGSGHSFTTSYQMDSSTGLTYLNQLDCTYTATVPSGYFVVAIITRFELETKLTGSCVDYLDAHDGTDTSAAKINTDEICGWGSSIPGNLTSSGEALTLRFVTDNNGVYLGFAINFVAATIEPCSNSQYNCNTSICIDSSLECDTYNQCGDSSDEDNCPETSDSDSLNIVLIVIIVLICLSVIGSVAAYIAYRIHSRNQWKKFLHSHIDDDDGIIEPGPSYPITHQYYKGLRGNPIIYTGDVGHTNAAAVTGEEKSGASKNDKLDIVRGLSDIPSVSSIKTNI